MVDPVEGELSFRVATGADYDAVLSLGQDIHGGLDYLPSMYHLWLHEPSTHMILTEHNDRVVGTLLGNPNVSLWSASY